ncbi:MAG: aminopeptidase P family protein [Clostridia bacterium]|nr:aminopeptidase P family protein [Clostridia bacterium]
MNDRLRWIRNNLKTQNIQGMIIQNPVNIHYLSNIDAEGVLLLTLKENFYITDERYLEKVQRTLMVDDEIVVLSSRNLIQEDYENFFMFCENVGFEEHYVTYAKYKEIMHKYKVHSLVETEGIIEKQRQIKDFNEIKNLRKACQITDDCFTYLLKYIKKGMTEKQIADEIEKYFKASGGVLAFDTIVASGENSSMPHATPTDRKIISGDVITIDMGCSYNGYCADMTRTIFVDKIEERVKASYDLVLENQNTVIEEMKDGAQIKIIARIVEGNLKMHGHDPMHALGHGVGMNVHEDPILSQKSDKVLKENMVIAVEPGIYIPGKYGIRIEDTVLITREGTEILTKSTKEYCVI